MINLTPIDMKQDRHYRRNNLLFLRWITQSTLMLLLLIVSVVAGFGLISGQQKRLDKEKELLNKEISDLKLSEIESSYSGFVANVDTVTQILSKQILYSDLIKQIGSVTPSGAILNSISISSKDNALDLNFKIDAQDIAPIIQLNLEDEKNNLFSKADIVQLNCPTTSTCTAQLKAEYKKDFPYLFVNTLGGQK